MGSHPTDRGWIILSHVDVVGGCPEGICVPNHVLSCFSGAGGMDLGLEKAGFESVGCIELNQLARDTLKKNRTDDVWPVLEMTDVVEAGRSLMPSDLGIEPRELMLLAGGPPCQPFSMAAQWSQPKKGMADDRGERR
jgi:DNA (cytosine-5)-methyltransferase 1